MTSDLSTIAEKSDHEIVCLCIEDNTYAWDEFYKRFIPLVLNSIKLTLSGYGRFGKIIAKDEAALWDIFELLYNRLSQNSLLKQYHGTRHFRAWLTTVSANLARDWIAARFTDKELPLRNMEESMISLDQPLGDDGSSTLIDIFMPDSDNNATLHDVLHDYSHHESDDTVAGTYAQVTLAILVHLAHLSNSSKTSDTKKFWIARIFYAGVFPLVTHEIEQLAEISKTRIDQLQDKIDQLMARINKLSVAKEAALGRAEIIRFKLLRIQANLNHHLNDPTPEGKLIIMRLRDEIERMSKNRADLLKFGLRMPRPTAEEISGLLMLPTETGNQISKILARLKAEFLDILKIELLQRREKLSK